MQTTLYIGNKNYSSWSLRPWLCLRWASIPFEEHAIQLGQPGYGEGLIEEVRRISPGGRVPALRVNGQTIWDSLAIAEWAAEQKPAELWPDDAVLRARARSVVSEMHSGFPSLRNDLPMNLHRRSTIGSWSESTQRDIDRVIELWQTELSQNTARGPWLFGRRSIADAFYLPVLTRFRTYGVQLPTPVATYSAVALQDADFLAWEAASEPDSWDQLGFSVIDGMHR